MNKEKYIYFCCSLFNDTSNTTFFQLEHEIEMHEF